jgi:hypothetical protein
MQDPCVVNNVRITDLPAHRNEKIKELPNGNRNNIITSMSETSRGEGGSFGTRLRLPTPYHFL